MALAETFTNEQLFAKGIYTWVGGSTLGSYFVSCTSSHYDWAIKKLKAHIKTVRLDASARMHRFRLFPGCDTIEHRRKAKV